MAFGDNLGPLFLQVGDNFTPKSLPDLRAYLEKLPKDVPVFLELRHKEWFAVPEHRNAIFNLLHQLKIGAVITDASAAGTLCIWSCPLRMPLSVLLAMASTLPIIPVLMSGWHV